MGGLEAIKNKVQGDVVDPEQVFETLVTLNRLVPAVVEGIDNIIGLHNQLSYHSQIIEMLEDDLKDLSNVADPTQIPYSLQELFKIEASLTALYDIIIRLSPAAYTESGVILKEVRTLLCIGYERQNLLTLMLDLISFLSKNDIFKLKNGNKLSEGKFTDTNVVRVQMKKDEDSFMALLKRKCEELKFSVKDSNLETSASQALQFLDNGTKIMAIFDALDIEEIMQFDKAVRKKILEDECNIDKKNIDFDNASLGEGVFGAVDSATLFYGKKNREKTKVALKTLKIGEEILKDEYVELTNEIQKWKMIESSFIAKCFGMALRKNHFHIVIERLDFSLYDHLHEHGRRLEKKEIDKLARDVSLGLLQLHSLNITHRNLCSQNVMMTSERLGGPIKLTDFGCGLYKYRNQIKGPSPYTPPEVLNRDSFNYNHHGWTTKGDIYSFGVLLWEGSQEDKFPFGDKMFDLHQVVGQEKKKLDLSVGGGEKWVKKLISDCLRFEPGERPNAKDICERVFADAHRDMKKNMKEDLIKIKESVAIVQNAYASDLQGTSARGSREKDPVKVSDIVAATTLSAPTENVSREAVLSVRKKGPPGLAAVASAPKVAPPPKHRPVVNEEKGVNEDDMSEKDEEEDEEAKYDDDRFYENEREKKSKKKVVKEEEEEKDDGIDAVSEVSRGPNGNEINKARRIGGLVKLAQSTCSAPKKLSPRVKALTEEALAADRFEFSSMFSALLLKTKLKDVDCEVLGLLMRWNTRLVRVILEFNKISNAGVDFLATGVSHHPTLLQLYIGRNPKITQIEKLLKKLQKNKVLELLGLDGCSLDNLGAQQIGKFLSANKTLLQIDISENEIGSDGMQFIAEGLERNTTLQGLIVQNQKVSCSAGMKKLRKVARKRKLNLNKRVVD